MKKGNEILVHFFATSKDLKVLKNVIINIIPDIVDNLLPAENATQLESTSDRSAPATGMVLEAVLPTVLVSLVITTITIILVFVIWWYWTKKKKKVKTQRNARYFKN